MKIKSPLFMMSIIAVMLLILINFYTIRITSAVRAYINGESRYSKGQMEAARHLIAFIPTGALHHKERFFEEISVPIGDRFAREALTRNEADSIAWKGFLAGNNHPDDIQQLIWLFRTFKEVSFMRQAISIWKSADEDVAKLSDLGNEIFNTPKEELLLKAEIYISQVDILSKSLSYKEKEFSQILGAAARSINIYLFTTNVVLIVIIIGTASRMWSSILASVRKSNLQLRKTLEFGKMGSAILDHKGTGNINMSSEFKQILEIPFDSRETFTLQSFVERFVIPQDRGIVLNATTRGIESETIGAVESLQYRVKTKTGNIKIIDAQGFFLENEVFGIFKDITSIRRIEEEIVNSEKRLKSILESLPVAVYMTDEEGCIDFFNAAAKGLWGREPIIKFEKWCGSHMLFTADGRPLAHNSCAMAVSIKERRAVQDVAKLQKPDGSFADFLAHATPFWSTTNQFAGAMNVMIDITEQKKQEHEIRTHKKFLTTLIGNLPGFVYRSETEIPYRLTYATAQIIDVTGYSSALFLGGEVTLRQLIHRDDLEEVNRKIDQALEAEDVFDLEYRIVKRNGEICWLSEKGRAIRDEDNQVFIESFVEDINKNKRYEIALRESEERYRKLIRDLHVGVVIYNPSHEIIFVNDAVVNIFGVSREELLEAGSLNSMFQLVGEDNEPIDLAPAKKAIEAKQAVYGTIFGARFRNGKNVWLISDAIPILDESGRLLHTICTLSDISEKVYSTAREKETATRLLLAASAAKMGIWEYNIAANELQGDVQLQKLLQVPAECSLSFYDWWLSVIHPDDRKRIRLEIQRAVVSGSFMCEYKVNIGNYVGYLASRGIVEKDKLGKPVKIIGVAWDVTENRIAQNAVVESERRFRHVADTAPVMIWMTDTERNGTYFNKGWLDFTGSSFEAQLGCGWTSSIHPDDKENFFTLFLSSFEQMSHFQVTIRMYDGNAELRWLRIHGAPRLDADAKFLGFIGTCIDVTESVVMSTRLEQNHVQLEELLKEKDVLIREIHHRVKNNLQVMSSVLFLKAQTLRDPAMRELLSESRQRLRSIAIIHERLMQSGGQITQLNIKEYLQGLVHEQKQALLIDAEQITVNLFVEDRMMNLEHVVNLGFIINETFTNCVKHAFPLGRKGNITVKLMTLNNKLQLEIADDGVGLPPHVTLENTNLFGVQLIKVFTSHLGGTVSLRGINGTCWSIVF